MNKIRLDNLVLKLGFAETRSKAKGLIMAGHVKVDGVVVDKAGTSVSIDSNVEILDGVKYVGRGGRKLEGALDEFNVDVSGKICADVGVSTGGFTDCLLQRGAGRVYCIDVGKGVIHWKLRNDNRVVVKETTNVRYLKSLPQAPEIVTVDVSFISLKLVLPSIRKWIDDNGIIIALIKPQFEAGRRDVRKGGIVRSKAVHRRVLGEVIQYCYDNNFFPSKLMVSPLRGAKGNVELFGMLTLKHCEVVDEIKLIDKCIESIEL